MITSKNKIKRGIYAILMLLVCIRAALRGADIGNDTYTYLHVYYLCSDINYINDIFTSDLTDAIEAGYLVLNWICARIFDSSQSVLIVTSIFSYFVFYKYIKKYSPSLLLSFFIFFLLGFSDSFMNTIRQAISMSLALIAYDCIRRKNFKLYVIFLLIAFLFHKSVLIFFPAWWLSKINMKDKYKFLFITASVVVMFGVMYANFYINLLMGGYSHYMESEYAEGGKIAPLMNLLMFAIMYLYVEKRERKYKLVTSNPIDYQRMKSLLFIGLCIMIISLSNALIFRLASYYTMFVIFLLPMSLNIDKGYSRIWSLVIMTVLIIYYCVINIYRPDWNHIYPYHFYWEVLK